jgi:hypothetical protein
MSTPFSLVAKPSYGCTYSTDNIYVSLTDFFLNSWDKKDKDAITTFNIADIKCNVEARMTQDGMVLFGLLSGADYNKV